MKKFLILAVATLFAGSAMALDNEPKTGVTTMGFLGLNVSQIRNSGYDGKAGGTMGARLDYVLPKAHGTYVTAGVDWAMRGGKYDDIAIDLATDPTGATTSSATVKANLHYVEIPIRVGFRYNFSQEIGVYGELGPYFAVGIGGKHKLDIDADGTPWRTLEDQGTWKAFKKSTVVDHDNFQRWDAGLGFRVGAEYNKHYNLMLGCDWGFTDIWRDDYRDVMASPAALAAGISPLQKAKNFNFTLAFGYRF